MGQLEGFCFLKQAFTCVCLYMYICVFSLPLLSLIHFSLPDRKVFLATWKEIAPSNEVQGSVDNVSLTAGTCIMLDELACSLNLWLDALTVIPCLQGNLFVSDIRI